MKKYKVVRRIPMHPIPSSAGPVIEKSFDTKEEAEQYRDKVQEEQRIRMMRGGFHFMRRFYAIEKGNLNYKSEGES